MYVYIYIYIYIHMHIHNIHTYTNIYKYSNPTAVDPTAVLQYDRGVNLGVPSGGAISRLTIVYVCV